MFTRISIAIHSRFQALLSNERGATAVEYGLIVGLIAVVLVVAVTALSGALGNMFNGIAGVLNENTPPPTP